MKQSQFYYLLRRGLFKGASIVKEGLVMFNKFTTAGISHPAQGSAEFDGASDIVKAIDVVGSESALTISCWMNTRQTSYPSGFISKGTNGNSDFVLFSNLSTYKIGVYLVTNNGNSGNIYSATTINDGNWHYVAASWDGSNVRLYVDGSLENSGAITGTLNNTDNVLGIGGYSNDRFYLDGNLANVAIWNRALSSDEINSVMWKGYQSLTSTEQSGLQAWYSLDDVASPSASLATMEALAVDKDATIENTAAITAAINALS